MIFDFEMKRWSRHSPRKRRTPSAAICIQEIFTLFALCEKCGFFVYLRITAIRAKKCIRFYGFLKIASKLFNFTLFGKFRMARLMK